MKALRLPGGTGCTLVPRRPIRVREEAAKCSISRRMPTSAIRWHRWNIRLVDLTRFGALGHPGPGEAGGQRCKKEARHGAILLSAAAGPPTPRYHPVSGPNRSAVPIDPCVPQHRRSPGRPRTRLPKKGVGAAREATGHPPTSTPAVFALGRDEPINGGAGETAETIRASAHIGPGGGSGGEGKRGRKWRRAQ
jgi:hypothetical protein